MKQKNYPSVKAIMDCCSVDKTTAEKVRAVMSHQIRVTDNADFPRTNKWLSSCYNRPRGHRIRFEAINELLGGFGVEVEGDVHSYPPQIDLEYVNMGDTYNGTVLYDGRWKVGTWADWVERNERQCT